jgi:uncharacterized protein
MIDPLADFPQCLDCGACCHTHNPQLVELLGTDAVEVPAQYVEAGPEGTFHMQMVEDKAHDCLVCSALGEKNACKIYARRPFLCREFERGSPECRQAIADMKRKRAERLH